MGFTLYKDQSKASWLVDIDGIMTLPSECVPHMLWG